jgi:hypothetical protein
MIDLRGRVTAPADSGGLIMRTHRTARILIPALGWALLLGAGTALRAGEKATDKALAKHGLRRAGAILVLEAESEVHAKAEEVRHLSAQLSLAVTLQRATLSEKEYQDKIKELTAALNQLRAESNAVTQNMNRFPRYRTRRGSYFANNEVTEEYQGMAYYRDQLQAEIQQRTAFLNQIKSRPYDRKDRLKADNEVRERLEALHQGASDLRKLVDGARAKYAAVAKDPQVAEWLDTPEGHAGVKPKLGPSRAFLHDEKLLERAERETSADEPGRQRSRRHARAGGP